MANQLDSGKMEQERVSLTDEFKAATGIRAIQRTWPRNWDDEAFSDVAIEFEDGRKLYLTSDSEIEVQPSEPE